MVHHFLAAPFADAAQAGQYAAVRAALQADAATPSLLLGNLVLEDGATPLDAVVVRPHGITLLVLVPRGGRLSIPALGYGGWQLGSAPLPGADDFDNPFEQLVQQKLALAAWLRARFSPEQANLRFVTGIVLFGAPVAFAPDVEPALNSAAAAGFQLLSDAADLPRRLRQLATPEIDLSPEDLAEWAAEWRAAETDESAHGPAAPHKAEDSLADALLPEGDAALRGATPTGPAGADGRTLSDSAAVPESAALEDPSSFLGQKAKALWGWLGAVDVPDDDPPYGYDPAGAAASREEKERLERLRHEMQADLNGQLQALEAREAERERSIAQLRAELAQAPPVAAEATALVSRLGAETREKAALEAEMQASRAESAARNQELDAKIQQLGQLIERLNTAPPVSAAPVALPVALPVAAPVALPVAAPVALPVSAPVSAPVAAAGPAPLTAAPVVRTEIAGVENSSTMSSGSAPGSMVMAGAEPATAAPLSRPSASAHSARLELLGAALQHRSRQVREWGRQRPRVALAAAGVVVLALGAWGLSHTGGGPPVPFQENGRWGYADASGKPVVPAQYTAASAFNKEGQAVVAKDDAYGLVDEQGKELVAPAYDALNPYAGGFARARVGDAYTFLDEKGEEFDHYYFNALDFAEGRAAVLDHRGWHYINGPEEPAKPTIFGEAYSFADGLARVKLADGYTFITPAYLDDPAAGTKPFGRYELAADFVDGKARVTQGGRRFVIDKDGDEVK